MYDAQIKRLKREIGKTYDTLKKYDCFLAGGAVTSIFTGKDINDFDLYFKSSTELYEFMTNEHPYLLFASDKAFTFKIDSNEFQAIFFRYFDKAEDIFETFDFSCCMGAYDFKQEKFILHDDFILDNAQRTLRYNVKTSFPIVSARRLKKYADKGYAISVVDSTKLYLTIANLTLTSWEDSKEQIGGMYGEDFTSKLKIEEDEPFSVGLLLEKLSDLQNSEDDAKSDSPLDGVDFGGMEYDQYINTKLGNKIEAYRLGGKFYDKDFDKLNIPEKSLIITDVTGPICLYKYVKKTGDKYVSYYKNSFEYKISEVAEGGTNGIYSTISNNLQKSVYARNNDGVAIELIVNIEDIINDCDPCSVRCKKAFVNRVVEDNIFHPWYEGKA